MERIIDKGEMLRTTMPSLKPTRLDVYWVELGQGNGSIQGGLRPCVITTNDMANKFSPVIHVAPITSKMSKKNLPTHVDIKQGEGGLPKDSCILLEQNMPVNKSQLKSYVGTLSSEVGKKINKALIIQMGIN